VLVKVKVDGYGEVILELNEELDVVKELIKKIPFSSKVEVWKEEIYFRTPLSGIGGETCLKVDKGSVALWPPGRALCIFYGISQPYTPIVPIGEVVGPLHTLSELSQGVEVRVESYQDDEGLPLELRRRGLCAARRIRGGEESVVVNLKVKGFTLRFEAYEEEYGIPIEGEPLFKWQHDYSSISALRRIKEAIKDPEVRIDINEEGYLVLSSYAKEVGQVIKVLSSLAQAYLKVLNL